MSSSTKKLCLGTPEDYDGREKTFQAWIQSIQLYLLVNDTTYDTDQKKIAFALSFVKKGPALGWATTFTTDAINNNKFGTFPDFVSSLKTTFLTTDLKGKALATLQSLIQHKDNMLGYINEFKVTTHLSGVTDQTVLIHLFSEGLNPVLMCCIYSMDSIPTIIEDWYTKAERFQAQWNRSNQVVSHHTKDHKIPSSFMHPYLPSTSIGKPKDPNAMDVDAIRIRKLIPEE